MRWFYRLFIVQFLFLSVTGLSANTPNASHSDIKLTLPVLPEHSSVQSAATLTETTGIQAVPLPGTVPSQLSNLSISDNGVPIATTAEEVKERCPPKAMVKPQVLTHVIEDFVIQESSEPFPVTKGALLGEFKAAQTIDKDSDEPPSELIETLFCFSAIYFQYTTYTLYTY